MYFSVSVCVCSCILTHHPNFTKRASIQSLYKYSKTVTRFNTVNKGRTILLLLSLDAHNHVDDYSGTLGDKKCSQSPHFSTGHKSSLNKKTTKNNNLLTGQWEARDTKVSTIVTICQLTLNDCSHCPRKYPSLSYFLCVCVCVYYTPSSSSLHALVVPTHY